MDEEDPKLTTPEDVILREDSTPQEGSTIESEKNSFVKRKKSVANPSVPRKVGGVKRLARIAGTN